jgi:hypothetical protein
MFPFGDFDITCVAELWPITARRLDRLETTIQTIHHVHSKSGNRLGCLAPVIAHFPLSFVALILSLM